jgi:signal transduction histidine kinase
MRWLVPLSLSAIALLFEAREHLTEPSDVVEPWFIAEVAIFAVVGPIAVFLILVWVERLVAAYDRTSVELAVVNRDLEARIEERTAHLVQATEQLREANAELERVNEDLRALDRLKSEFVSLVSHQLRAPVTNINGALEMVTQEADTLPADTQRTLGILAHESQRLSWLIQTILDVSRIEAGRLKPRLGPVAVGPLLDEVSHATMEVQAERRLEVRVAEGLPPAWADETLLGEVVHNLVENALRYSPADTPVVVAVELADEHLEISVVDHGPGIPKEEQERIFLSFHRLSDQEGSVDGSGLGLYFADRLVRAQGGSIRVESPAWPDAQAPGTRFSFEVPVVGDVPDDEPASDARPMEAA